MPFKEYVIKRFDGTKLDFSKLNNKYGFCLLKNEDNEKIFFSSFKRFAEMSWDYIIKDKGFDYKFYNNQKYFAEELPGKKIYKFRTSEKFRCYGYREDDIFFVVRFEVDHRLSDQG